MGIKLQIVPRQNLDYDFMDILTLILNDEAYGNERAWNVLRLAKASLVTKSEVNIFLMGDAVTVAKKG